MFVRVRSIAMAAALACCIVVFLGFPCQADEPGKVARPAAPMFEILKQPAAPKNAQNDSSEAKIRRALDARIRVKLVDAELGPFCRELAKKFGINVLLDREALKEMDLGGDTLVNFSCRDLSVKSALRHMLRDFDLTWIIHREVLMITNEEVAQENREIKVYDVADLVTIPRGKGDYDFDFESLIDVIASTIEPESWVEMGGNGTIEPFLQERLQVLVISQTDEVHEQVANLLTDLRVHLPKKALGKEDPLVEQRFATGSKRKEDKTSIRKITSPEEKINRALDKKFDLNLEKVPLSQLAARLEKMLGVPVQIDLESLEEYDLSGDTLLSAHHSGVTARSALTLALRPLDLGYTVVDDCLVISTQEYVDAHRKTRVYDVADLVESCDADLSAPDFEPLIEVITISVDVVSWNEFGGNGTIFPFEGGGARVLVIKQTWSTHNQIEKLLAQLRKVRREGNGRPLPLNYRKNANVGPREVMGLGGLNAYRGIGARPLFGSQKRVVVKLDPDRDELVRGNNRFALELFGRLRAKAKGQNVFFSPMSVSTAVAMAHAGARGETAEEIGQALHFTLPPRRLYPACGSLLAASHGSSGHELTVANRLWIQKGHPFRDEYVRITRNHFGAEGKILDFVQRPDEAVREINHWTAQATGNRIQQLITRDMITDDLAMVLTNAVYFKGEWQKPFEKRATKRQPFHAPGGQKMVPLMTLEDNSTEYAQIDDPPMQILKKPYRGGDLSMIVLLPADKPGALDGLEAKLTGDNLDKWLKDLKHTTVEVYLPRFRLDTNYDLVEPLKSLGMKSAFDMADFSGIDGGVGELFIAWIVHKAFVEVDEEGTVAAAATAMGMGGMIPPDATPVFRADRPFVFLIRDDRTGSILFLGRLSNP